MTPTIEPSTPPSNPGANVRHNPEPIGHCCYPLGNVCADCYREHSNVLDGIAYENSQTVRPQMPDGARRICALCDDTYSGPCTNEDFARMRGTDGRLSYA